MASCNNDKSRQDLSLPCIPLTDLVGPPLNVLQPELILLPCRYRGAPAPRAAGKALRK